MSAVGWLKKQIGIIEGLLAPGWKATVAEGAHAIEQDLAKAFGDAALAYATSLFGDTATANHEKPFLIAEKVAQAAIDGGWKAEISLLKTFALPVAQAAFLQALHNAEDVVMQVAKGAPAALEPVATFAAQFAKDAADKEIAKLSTAG